MTAFSNTARLLRDLVALPSINPDFRPPNDSFSGEHRVGDFLCSLAGKSGLEVERQIVLEGRDNILVHLMPPERVTRRIVLAPHLDTVGGDEVPGLLFTPLVRNEKLHGRGACDTKGSVAAMFSALLTVAAGKKRPRRTEIVFAGLIGEEHYQEGSRALAASGIQADLAIVGEPTQCKVVTAHKGNLWLELRTRGKSAHGARPELGRNAVHEMARVVDLLETDYARWLQRRTHPLLGRPTINVGTIRGGTQPNVVPAECRIGVDRRTLPGETEFMVRRDIQTLLRMRHLKARFSSLRSLPCPPLETDANLPIVKEFLRVNRQKQPVGVDYFCDAAILAKGGISSVVFGPGNIAQAHTSDEWISLKSLDQAADRLVHFLQAQP